MEREFAAFAAEAGWVEAFLKYSTPDGQMAGRDGIVGTRAVLGDVPRGDRSLRWWPVVAGIARSNDLGFTTGSFSVDESGAPRGQYFTVWERQPDGSWRWVFDGGPGSVLEPVTAEAAKDSLVLLPVAEGGAGSAEDAVAQVTELEAGLGSARDLARHLAPEARVHRRQRPRGEGGAAAVENSTHPAPDLRYELVSTEASAAGDLVFTLGRVSWQAGEVARAGSFARIWQWQNGAFRVIYDQVVEQPPPAD